MPHSPRRKPGKKHVERNRNLFFFSFHTRAAPSKISGASARTCKVDDEAVLIAQDAAPRIRLKLDGDVSHGGVQLEPPVGAGILAQDPGRQVVPVIESQRVSFAKA